MATQTLVSSCSVTGCAFNNGGCNALAITVGGTGPKPACGTFTALDARGGVQGANGSAADFDADPTGQFWQSSYGGRLSLRPVGNEVRAWSGASAGPGGTDFHLVDGRIVAIERMRHFIGSYCR